MFSNILSRNACSTSACEKIVKDKSSPLFKALTRKNGKELLLKITYRRHREHITGCRSFALHIAGPYLILSIPNK